MSSASILVEIGKKKYQKSQYELREGQVRNLKDGLDGQTEDFVSAINRRIDSATENLTDGMKGIAIISSFCDGIEALKEEVALKDSHLSCAYANLQSEESDCSRKVTELGNEIDDLNVAYQNALEAELEAARKAAEEAAKRLEEEAKKILKL